jgi:hypothetical protein
MIAIEAGARRRRGRDERLRTDNFYEGVEFTCRLMKAMSARE